MRYICENNLIRLIDGTAVGTVVTIHCGIVVVQKFTGGTTYLPLNMVNAISYVGE